MSSDQITSLIIMGACVILGLLSFFWLRVSQKKIAAESQPSKKLKRKRILPTLALTLCGWLFTVRIISFFFGSVETSEFSVELFPERINISGFNISTTVLITWMAMAILIIAALLIRIIVIPRMKDVPKGIQNILEAAIEGITGYTEKQAGHLGDNLSAYLFTLALLMVISAALELFGFRPPTADITMAFAMAIITFFLINYYGLREKGLGGRIKSMASPTVLVLPMKIVSEIAIPVSLACRLFGNMLGGMIVIDLLYYALGNAGILFPSALGLYFNVFHPLIQTFIFVTLSLTFINEAAE